MTADGEERPGRRPMVTTVALAAPGPGPGRQRPGSVSGAKPTPADLGVDLAALDWQRSGSGHGSFEIAFVAGRRPHPERGGRSAHGPRVVPAQPDQGGDVGNADWVLLRVAGDPEGRVLVYDRNEWMCFLDGAGRGEFDSREGLTRFQVA